MEFESYGSNFMCGGLLIIISEKEIAEHGPLGEAKIRLSSSLSPSNSVSIQQINAEREKKNLMNQELVQ